MIADKETGDTVLLDVDLPFPGLLTVLSLFISRLARGNVPKKCFLVNAGGTHKRQISKSPTPYPPVSMSSNNHSHQSRLD